MNPNEKRRCRRKIQFVHDPLALPLTKAPRCWSAPDDYEGGFEFWIDPSLLDATDEEIEEYMDELEEHNNTPYDCSGKLCTSWISWSRTPSGVAIIHRKDLDV